MEENDYDNIKARSLQIMCKPWNMWKHIWVRFNRTFSILFNRIGRTIAMYPWVAISFVILLTCGTGWAVRDLPLDNNAEKLYSSKEATSVDDLSAYRRSFETGKYRSSFLIISKQENGNILTPKIISIANEIHKKVILTSGFETVCLRSTFNQSQCLYLNPLELISTNHSGVYTTTLISDLTNALKNNSWIMSNDQPASSNAIDSFGKALKYDVDGNIISAPVMRFYYVQNRYASSRSKQAGWEANFTSIVSAARAKYSNDEFDIYYSTMQGDESSAMENISSMLIYYCAALGAMLFFAWACYIKPHSPKKSHGFLMCLGVLVILMAMVCSLGLLGIIGAMFTKVVVVLPLVVLGIAIDDIFIIVDTFDRLDENMNIEDRVAMTMEHCGVTISMTTLTDLIAFIIGSKSSFPAISYFCIYGFTFLLIGYLFIVTMFVALLTLEARWDQDAENSNGCCKCCRKSSLKGRDLKNAVKLETVEEGQEIKHSLADKIMRIYATLLMKKPAKIIVVCLSVMMVAGSCYYAPKISLDFDISMLMKEQSMAKMAYDATVKYYFDFSTASVVLHPCNNDGLKSLATELQTLPNIMLKNTDYYEINLNSVVEHFPHWMVDARMSNITILEHLKNVLIKKTFARFNRDLHWSVDATSLNHIKFNIIMKDGLNSEEKANAMGHIREFMSSYFKCPAFVASEQFVYLEQFAIIQKQTAYSLVVCAIAVLSVASIFVIHPGIILLLLVSFAVLLASLFAVMYLWNVWLNIVSMVVLLMALGFTVDYSCHIVFTFTQSRKPTSDEKVIEALESTGASVLMGGMTTGLASTVLGFTNASMAVIFFKLLVAIVTLGLINGLVILPVYLSILFTESGKIKQRKKLTLKMLPSMLATPKPGCDQKFLFYADTPTVIPMTPKQINCNESSWNIESIDPKQNQNKQPTFIDRFKYT